MALQDSMMFFLEGHDNRKKIDNINKKLDGFINNQVDNNNTQLGIINDNKISIKLSPFSPINYTNDTNKYHLIFFKVDRESNINILVNDTNGNINTIYQFFIVFNFTNIINNTTTLKYFRFTQCKLSNDYSVGDGTETRWSNAIQLHAIVPPMTLFRVGVNENVIQCPNFATPLEDLMIITNISAEE